MLTADHFHAADSPCVRRIVDFKAWRGVPNHPARHPCASATSRQCRHAANPPRAPPRSMLSAGIRHCGPTPGAGWGGYRSLPFDSHRFLVDGSSNGGRQLRSSAAAAAAAANAAPQAALTAARRRRSEQWYAAARGGATTVERAAGGRETAGAAAEKAGECVAAVQVQCARVRACLLM